MLSQISRNTFSLTKTHYDCGRFVRLPIDLINYYINNEIKFAFSAQAVSYQIKKNWGNKVSKQSKQIIDVSSKGTNKQTLS